MPSTRGPLLPIISGKRHADAPEQAAHDRERLLEARDPVVVRNPERAELGLVPARAEAEHEAPAADLVDRRGHLRDQPRRVTAGARDQRTEPHALGRRRERREQRPRLPRRALGPPVAAVEQVVADPDRVEAALLGGARHREVLRPAHLALDLGKLDADAHGGRRYGPRTQGGAEPRDAAARLRGGAEPRNAVARPPPGALAQHYPLR